ncbi:ABC transporter substrate-binding protein [Propionivibrio sp.]|uniref:ABC transporter substrate-binding protein n=1 Tax=Propionivibrio sp. TaxID=2212460 RepID=UPI0039E23878
MLLALSVAHANGAANPEIIRFGVADIGIGGKPVAGGTSVNLVHIRGLLDEEFKKDGIKVEWSFFKGAGPAVNESIANGQLDFAWQGDLPAIIARAGGLKTKLILATDKFQPTYLVVPADSPAKSIEDLKGRKVAIFKGTNLQLVAIRVYEGLGLTERDFKTINMDQPTIQTALATKDIEGGWLGAQAFNLVDKGIARILYATNGPSTKPVRRTIHVLVTEDFEKQQPRIVQRVVNTILKEAAWLADDKHRDEAYALWSRSGIAAAAYKRDQDADFALRHNPLIDELFITHYKEAADASFKNRLIRKPVEVDSWFETKYLKQGLKDLKLEKLWPEFDAGGKPRPIK